MHAGHALFVTLQDIMTRCPHARQESPVAPGADHAGFETQVVYEKVLEKEGRSRFQMPPEQLYKEILDFTLANKSFMEGQLRQLGASCDWSREMFTLDQRWLRPSTKLLRNSTKTVFYIVEHESSTGAPSIKPLFLILKPSASAGPTNFIISNTGRLL